MKQSAYCPHCRTFVEFETVTEKESVELDGTTYAFSAKQAICTTCGGKAVYAPYREEAGLALADAVRSANGLVTLEIVRDLPKRYNIGKRPLSKLLGWGELTYSRFIEGTVPKKSYSDRIIELYENPQAFLKLLKENNDAVTSVAYKKSLRTVEAIISDEYPEGARLFALGEVIMGWAKSDITNMALQKLTYYIQGFSIPLLKQPIFTVEPHAWAYGPVYGQLWHEFKEGLPECSEENFLDTPFSEDELDLVIAVCNTFGKYSGPELSKFTHQEAPWVDARERAGATEGEWCNEPITLESMGDYFSKVVEECSINRIDEIGRYIETRADTSMQTEIFAPRR